MNLPSLGWNSAFEEAFAEIRAEGLVPARVAMEDKHAYVVLTEEHGDISASVSGRFLHQRRSNAELPKVGDWVAVSMVAAEEKALIHQVLPRRTRLARKLPGRDIEEQVLAANMDTAFIVQALDASFSRRRLERFLVMVHEGGSQAVVVMNKADLSDEKDPRLVEARLAVGGTPLIVASAKNGRGLGLLREFIRPSETVVFIGPSGVGKSSLINRLYGEEIQATIEVREQDAKGRHTTSWRELIQLPNGGLVIDTPGMREFHIWMADGGLEEAFPDIEEMGVRCHFRDCSHTVEKRCAVQEALAKEEISRERYDSYLKLRHELDYLAEERKKHTYLTRQRESKVARQGLGKARQKDVPHTPE